MGDNTGIEWTDASWTPIRARSLATGKVGWHCEHVTPGCENCYAEAMNARLGTGLAFKPGHRKDVGIFLDEKMLLQPLRWDKPRMIFVCSMTDLFAPFVEDWMLDRIFAVMAATPRHTYQVLTKRSDRMRSYLTGIMGSTDAPRGITCPPWSALLNRVEELWLLDNPAHYMETIRPLMLKGLGAAPLPNGPLPNVWLGASAEDQQRYDERRPHLEATPAARRFWSIEPMLGPIDMKLSDDWGICNKCGYCGPCKRTALGLEHDGCKYLAIPECREWHQPDWVIIGDESGPHRRACELDWVRSIRDQCAAAGTSFFLKQLHLGGRKVSLPMLDGRTHQETPEARQ